MEFPGGESYEALRERALAALEEIRLRHPGETVALVAHAGPLRAMLAECLSMPAAAIFRLGQGYGAMSIVEWIDAIPVVKLLNGTPQASARSRLAPPGARSRRRGAWLPRVSSSGRRCPPGSTTRAPRARRERADGWRFDAEGRAAVARAIAERRDIRRFRPDPLPERHARAAARGGPSGAFGRAHAAVAIRRRPQRGDEGGDAVARRPRAARPG